mmetsp:Transcript_15804/g.19174  ORF Transcript_15804/g.19174 Transcript_15804/m.19174 type:complete len:432 (+) Transcript_15804:476-1771(+)
MEVENESSLSPVWLTDIKRATSYQIFMEFVEYRPDGSVLTERMLSRECYNKWIDSRQQPPSKPESSFRRALIGHVTGNDRRRPFPPVVEESLLKILRRKEVWECFRGFVPIGQRGFRKQGYHEENMTSTEEKSANDSDENDTISTIASEMSLPRDDEMEVTFISDENPLPEYPSKNSKFYSLNDFSQNIEMQKEYARAIDEYKWMQQGLSYRYTETEQNNCTLMCSSQSELSVIQKVLQLVYLSMKPETKEGKFASGIVYNIDSKLLFQYLRGYEVAKMQSPEIDMLGAKFYSKLSLNPDNDIRLSRSFLLAHPGFDRRKPVATILTSIVGGHRVVDASDDAMVLGESILGQVWTALQFPIQVAVRWCHAFPVAMTCGESWTHVVLKLKSGRRKVVLTRAKYFHKDPTLAIVEFQDVSEIFSKVLLMPDLI